MSTALGMRDHILDRRDSKACVLCTLSCFDYSSLRFADRFADPKEREVESNPLFGDYAEAFSFTGSEPRDGAGL